MGLSLVTAPTTDPISLAEAKAHLRVSGSDDDGLVAGYILAAREFAQAYTRRVFVSQTWDQTFDGGWPCDLFEPRIVLGLQPVVSITTVTYVDENGANQTLSGTTQYVAKTGDDQLGVIVPKYGVEWPTVRDQPNAVTVRFVAGYTRLPETIRVAMLLTLADFYENRENTVLGSTPSELPLSAARLLDPYRIY